MRLLARMRQALVAFGAPAPASRTQDPAPVPPPAFQPVGSPVIALPKQGGYRLFSATGPSDYQLAAILSNGLSHEEPWPLLMRWLQPGQVFFDVGANHGVLAIPAAALGAEVHAFEMLPANLVNLGIAIRENHLERCFLVSGAVGEGSGLTGWSGDSAWAQTTTEKRRVCPMLSLDDYVGFAAVPRVDMLKFDIEGSEAAALRGAQRLLRRDRPDLVIEINMKTCGLHGYCHRDLLPPMEGLGYRAFLIRPDALLQHDPQGVPPAIVSDVLFSTKTDDEISRRAERPVRAMTDADRLTIALEQEHTNPDHHIYLAAIIDDLPATVRVHPRLAALLPSWRGLGGPGHDIWDAVRIALGRLP